MCTSTPVVREALRAYLGDTSGGGAGSTLVWCQSVARRLSLEMSDMARRDVSAQDDAHRSCSQSYFLSSVGIGSGPSACVVQGARAA